MMRHLRKAVQNPNRKFFLNNYFSASLSKQRRPFPSGRNRYDGRLDVRIPPPETGGVVPGTISKKARTPLSLFLILYDLTTSLPNTRFDLFLKSTIGEGMVEHGKAADEGKGFEDN
jgi:hypothetical protein